MAKLDSREDVRRKLLPLQDYTCVWCQRRIRHASLGSTITGRTFMLLLRRIVGGDSKIARRLCSRAAAMPLSDDQILNEPVAVVHTERCFVDAVVNAHPTLTMQPLKLRIIRRVS